MEKIKMDTRLLINGKIISGEAEKTILVNPENNEVIVEVPCASINQVDAAVDAANTAFPAWKIIRLFGILW